MIPNMERVRGQCRGGVGMEMKREGMSCHGLIEWLGWRGHGR